MNRRNFIKKGLLYISTVSIFVPSLVQAASRRRAILASKKVIGGGGGGPTNNHLKTIVAGVYVYDSVDNLPGAAATLTITGGTGWTLGTYNVASITPNFDTGPDGLRTLYELTIAPATHPATDGSWTVP